MRPCIWLVALVVIVGCRAPMPWIKPVNTRVAPPATGTFGNADPYYPTAPAQPSSTPASGTPQGTRSATRSVSSTDAEDAGDTELAWTSPKGIRQRDRLDRYGATIRRTRNGEDVDSGVRQADFETMSQDYTPGSTRSGKRVDFRGMPVNDATGLLPAKTEFDDDNTSSRSATSSTWKPR